jgi:pimeloyl-ACP methyl ester carboxylesterase
MGGWLMLLVARARPARIAALVGIAAAPDFTEDLVWARLSAEERRTCTQEGGITLPSPYDPQGYRYRSSLFEDGRRHLVLRGRLAIAAPVRLIHGMRDDAVPWQTSLRLAQCLEGDDVALTLVKDGDHRLSRPQDLARLARTLDALTRVG